MLTLRASDAIDVEVPQLADVHDLREQNRKLLEQMDVLRRAQAVQPDGGGRGASEGTAAADGARRRAVRSGGSKRSTACALL